MGDESLGRGQAWGMKDLTLKLRGAQAGCMWAWVLSGSCHLGHMVPSRVAEVAVGGRDVNWERNPLAEGLSGV